MNRLIQYHLQRFQDFHEGDPWYGSSFQKIVDDLTPEEVCYIPANGHSIVRLLWHMVKWRRSLTERLKGNTSFRAEVNDPDNWPDPATLGLEQWKAALAAFDQEQRLLLKLLADKTDDFLSSEFLPGKNYDQLVRGVLEHDLYHIGQIAFIKSVFRASRPQQAHQKRWKN